MAHLTARAGRASACRWAKDGGRRSTTSPAIRRRRRWLAVAALAAAGLGMTGCRGGDQSTESTIAVRCIETRRSPTSSVLAIRSTVFDGTVEVRMRAPSWTDADEDFRVALEHVALQGDLDFTPDGSAAPIIVSGAEWADPSWARSSTRTSCRSWSTRSDGSSLSPSPLLHVPGDRCRRGDPRAAAVRHRGRGLPRAERDLRPGGGCRRHRGHDPDPCRRRLEGSALERQGARVEVSGRRGVSCRRWWWRRSSRAGWRVADEASTTWSTSGEWRGAAPTTVVVDESSVVVTSVTLALVFVAWALWARLPPMARAPTTAVAPAARRARRAGCGRRRRCAAGAEVPPVGRVWGRAERSTWSLLGWISGGRRRGAGGADGVGARTGAGEASGSESWAGGRAARRAARRASRSARSASSASPTGLRRPSGRLAGRSAQEAVAGERADRCRREQDRAGEDEVAGVGAGGQQVHGADDDEREAQQVDEVPRPLREPSATRDVSSTASRRYMATMPQATAVGFHSEVRGTSTSTGPKLV